MTLRLRDILDCFEGVIPSIIATTDAQGVPNISYLSHVHYVDDAHVALSNQFFSKTRSNVKDTGRATLMVVSAQSGEQYMLDLAFAESATGGELFERMAAHLRAISSQHGMSDVMALRAADVYRVIDSRRVPSAPGVAVADSAASDEDRLSRAARIAAAIGMEADPDVMIERALDGLADMFGFRNTMLLVPDESGERLTTLASRGYEQVGVGSEVAFTEGAIGIAAATRRAVRISDMSRGRRFTSAVLSAASIADPRLIPLPGLAEPQSQLAVPMVSQGRLYGVLFAEADERFHFHREDEDALALIGGHLASGLRLVELEGRESATEPGRRATKVEQRASTFRVKYFDYDDSVFIDDAYLIKGVSGRLLFYFLKAYVENGRREFTNREIRLDPSLRLPDLKDNLETRLILLRRRLDERAAPVRLVRPARGRIALDVTGAPRLEVVEKS